MGVVYLCLVFGAYSLFACSCLTSLIEVFALAVRIITLQVHLMTKLLLVVSLVLGRLAIGADFSIPANIDWPAFMSSHDMVWHRMPTKWADSPFHGNGWMGTTIYQNGANAHQTADRRATCGGAGSSAFTPATMYHEAPWLPNWAVIDPELIEQGRGSQTPFGGAWRDRSGAFFASLPSPDGWTVRSFCGT